MNQPAPVTIVTVTTSTASVPTHMFPPATTGKEQLQFSMKLSGEDIHAAKIADAIYGHVQAVRALGRNEISVAEVARALGLTEMDVMRALPFLRTKGVKTP